MIRPGLAILIGAAVGAATPARSLTPLPRCEGAVESGMTVTSAFWLGDQGGSGYTVEAYYDARVVGGQTGRVTPPVPALEGFVGGRVVSCATGQFVLIPEGDVRSAAAALSATEFLRDTLRSGASPEFSSVRRAAEALYGPVTVLRETAETCGCSDAFPGWRPAGMTPYEQRPDLG